MTADRHTTQQAADLLGLTPGRIRQLAQQLGLGETLHEQRGPVHTFSAADLAALRKRNTQRGRPRSEENKMAKTIAQDDLLAGLRCYFCDQPLDPAAGLHPDSLDLPGEGENQDVALRHYPGPGAEDAPCGDDRRAWVVYVGG